MWLCLLPGPDADDVAAPFEVGWPAIQGMGLEALCARIFASTQAGTSFVRLFCRRSVYSLSTPGNNL